ncbi:MAG: ABC transporter ATP-binding protein [Spirochaetales bacterium]|uniref:ABC transporter ATP-binding protein n=1 Tax=Candidatus Thalassospirochaeta sargassi TaxID=3119039 RepID=A0AAJ1IAC2_9SPIO|nr:ABC transporter ATP-binding protein [Spirochaetales bacterium]
MKKGHLTIKELNFRYPSWSGVSERQIFTDVSLELLPGEISVIFGGAESGKSSLALVISALVPKHTGGKISGSIDLDGLNIPGTGPAELTENCGIVFQDPERQTVTTECYTEVAFPLESLGVPFDEMDDRIRKNFDILGISHLVDKPVGETSGGEKKKIALAGLFVVAPDLWILDETMEELDNPYRVELMEKLKASGKTILILTSKYFSVFKKADSFYLLKDGTLSPRETGVFSRGFKKLLTEEGIIPDFSKLERSKPVNSGFTAGRPDSLLTAENLLYRYDGGFQLFIDSFTLSEGETLSIVGRNGCGKSTLAMLLCGLIEPSGGAIHAAGIEGVPPGNGALPAQLNAHCAYMFQNPDYQIFLPTVYDELAWGLKEAGCSPDIIKARVESTIVEFGLPDASTPPAMMSFSARKRLQAAIYYLLKRPVFILDEADTGLSFSDFIDLVERLKQICRGLIIITHNLELAAAVSDRVVGMSGGKIYKDILDFSADRLNEWLTESVDKHGDEE